MKLRKRSLRSPSQLLKGNLPRNTASAAGLAVALVLVCLSLESCQIGHTAVDGNAGVRPPYDSSIADQEVAWNEDRVVADPNGPIGWSQLAAAYLKRARLHDDNAFAGKAEVAARKSLGLRRKNNVNAATRLTESILEQHRFSEALAAAEAAIRIAPDDASPHVLHTEILVELGRYEEAWNEFKKYYLAGAGLAGMALQARLLQIDGNPSDAEAIMRRVCERADRMWDLERESVAWFHLKLGTLLWDEGKGSQAASQFEKAIDANSGDFKSIGTLARIYAARSNFSKAESLAKQSIDITPTVEVAALLEDIATRQNRLEDAQRYATLVDKVSHPDLYKFLQDPSRTPPTAKPHTHDRLYAMYCADRKTNLPDALTAARKDFAARQDVYGYDTMAWTLHQMGRDAEAKPMMVKALSRGTIDAKLFYHAGMIDAALSNSDLAKQELERALAINPNFQLIHSDRARAELCALSGLQPRKHG